MISIGEQEIWNRSPKFFSFFKSIESVDGKKIELKMFQMTIWNEKNRQKKKFHFPWKLHSFEFLSEDYVYDLMYDGWQCHHDTCSNANIYIQKCGCNKRCQAHFHWQSNPCYITYKNRMVFTLIFNCYVVFYLMYTVIHAKNGIVLLNTR